jgi:saccharopine dehydrogenase-like NADP-dependent oxidoreductase
VYHIHVAEACLEVGRNLVTASYISEPMQGLDAEVKKKGLIFLNELGLDPGIDHLSTMKVVDEIH